MAAFLSGLRRNWTILNPPAPAKHDGALKFGILGAAQIAPFALIVPARSHPEVLIYAVAARDKSRATAFAKKHNIPVVKDSYDGILDDPAIDVVYIPLPNGLHFEWSLKALAKGKHVLLEKPSANNTHEAESLFHHPLVSQPNAPIIMEAFHNRFTPVWQLFLSTLDSPNISHVLASATVPSFVAKDDDIRFNYAVGGGALLDLGTYTVAALRAAFASEPTDCIEVDMTPMPAPREKCEHTFHAKLSFPNGGIGEVRGTMRPSYTALSLPRVTVTHKPVHAPEEETGEGDQATKTRTVVFYNFMLSPMYHRIDVIDEFEVTKGSSSSIKKFTRKESKKAYTYREMGGDQPGEVYWSTYRHMLEQFVNKVKGREGTGVWVPPEESIAQAKVLDMIYEKSGLGLRPTSDFRMDGIHGLQQ